jgi:hypothetical protein
VPTRSGVTHRIVRPLAAADRSTAASTRLWLNVFTSRHCVIACDTNRVEPQPVSRIGWRDINAADSVKIPAEGDGAGIVLVDWPRWRCSVVPAGRS